MNMNILMISRDPRALERTSPVRERMQKYAAALGELHIMIPRAPLERILTGRAGHTRKEIASPLFLHPCRGGLFLKNMWICACMARALARQYRFDAITSQAPDFFGLAVYIATRRLKIPFELQIHTDVMSPWYRNASWKERAHYSIARMLIPRVSHIRVVSQRIADSLRQKYALRCPPITVLSVYTDIRRFLDAKPPHECANKWGMWAPKMIAAGRFVDKEKNFSMLIRCMPRILETSPNALLMIVGEGTDEKMYRAEIRARALENHVILMPWQDGLASLFAECDMFLMPSWYEGWGRAVIEAMAAGLPVVMTDVGLAGEVVKDGINGRVVPVGAEEKFLDAVREMLGNKELRAHFAEKGRETVLALSPKTEEEYLARYRESFEKCVKIKNL